MNSESSPSVLLQAAEMVLVPREPTKEMVQAYLRANDAYWLSTDRLPTPPGRWRTGTPSEATAEGYKAMLAASPQATVLPAQEWLKEAEPIDMALYCPKCGMQHVDAPEAEINEKRERVSVFKPEWTNPPHKSHLCHGCGHIWRPADVPTNGVAAIKTKGANDSPALLAHLAARPQEQPKPNTEAAHQVAPVGKDLPPALSEDTRDAARYRHMRASAGFLNRNGPGLYWYLPRFIVGGPAERLDAAIDAAIAAQAAQGKPT